MNFETLTIGMNRREGHKKLIEHFFCETIIELGVRQAEFSKFLVTETGAKQVYGIDIVDWVEAINLQHMYPTQYQFHVKDTLVAHDLFDNAYFDLIHFDDCHSENHVIEEIKRWWPKLQIGGIASFDDFMTCTDFGPNPEEFGVQRAVNKFVQKYNLQFYIIGQSTADMAKLNEFALAQGKQRELRFTNKPSTFIESPNAFIIKSSDYKFSEKNYEF